MDAGALVQRHGRVKAISEDGILVDDGAGTRLVRQATSCLLEPLVGDLVLLVAPVRDPGGHLLAVLERDSTQAATLSAPGDLVLATPRGRLSVRGAQGIELHTDKTLDLRADEARLQARSGKFFLTECAAVIRTMFASLTKFTHVGELLELLVDVVRQRSEHSTRVIAGTDQTQASDIDHKASNNVQIRSKRTIVDGREVVKLDGGQIHLG
ncbi:hypothetical protein DB30_01554 [Enhygromyxa salina]|uniref:DUF3540 domain-containing protein n=1 Tax=Enhygromyxa salina TaxID=215803 RepID=A0A0C1ZMS4_9BACT|nr:hypothetical protein DB30_01554 [Enhygromyxa salina]